MTPLPPQAPDQPPRYRFRPRSDRYTMPTFREPAPPREYSQPIETYDQANEARPFAWSEVRDPQLLGAVSLAVAIAVIVLIVVLSSGPMPVVPVMAR